MKKSLSAILSLAMAFSMFSSVALGAEVGKDSSSFSDLKDLDAATKAKFDAMISAGVFEGVSDGVFGLNDKMNRAQFAKVAALIFKLNVDTSLTTSTFSDVKADDPANGYALPYIEALKAAGLTNGYAPGQYNPAGEVTKQELAAFLLRGLGLDAQAKATPGVNDQTVSDWAKGYVALAIQKNILSNGADGTFGGTSAATRDLLVVASYAAQEQYKSINKPEKASVASAKAVGVQKVEVKLDRDVDTEKATLTLKKGSATIATTVAWSEDKTTATLTLTDAKISAGDYTVTLGGLDAAAVDKTVASFTAENEKLTSIDFLTTSDTIAYADAVLLKLAAKNQYGENASFSAGSYSVYTAGATFTKITKDDNGQLLLTLDTNTPDTTQSISIIPVTIVNNDQYLTVTKNFKLGVAPILTKLELGEAKYSNNKDAITGQGDNATFDLNLFDQYGGQITYDSPTFRNNSTFSVIWNQYVGTNSNNRSVVTDVVEDNGNNIPRLKLSLNENVDKSGEYTFTVTNQAATATGKVKIQSTKIATKVELGDFNDVIAAGDNDAYIPIVAYDAEGNRLSVDDLTSNVNLNRIRLTVSGAQSSGIETTGANKGSVRLTSITDTAKGSISVTAVIASANVTSTATRTYTIADVRVPDRIKEVKAPAKSAVAGAYSSFQYVVLDQYGKQMDYNKETTGTGNAVSVGQGNVTYSVYVALTGGTNFELARDDDNGARILSSGQSTTYGGAQEWTTTSFRAFNEGFRIKALPGSEGQEAKLTLAIRKTTRTGPNAGTIDIATTTKTIEGAPAANASNNEDYTYTLNTIGDLYYAGDSGLATVVGDVYGPDITNPIASPFKKRVTITVKNAAGDVVAVPDNFIESITSSNQVAARVGINGAGKAYVMGNKVGTSTITVSYRNNKGELKTASTTVTTKNEPVTITKIEALNKKVQVGAGPQNIADGFFNANEPTLTKGLMNLKVWDQYGVTYDGNTIKNFNSLLGLVFSVENITLKNSNQAPSANDAVTINGNVVTIGTNVASFDIIATAPNGQSVSTEVNVR